MCILFLLFLYEQIQQSEPFPCDDDASVGFCDCMKMNPGEGEFYSCEGYNLTEIPTEFAVTVSSLDLSRNYIESLPEDLFVHNPKLAQIILVGNKIKSFNSNMLANNTALHAISCFNCFDCTCMDSSSWEWIKQKYDNFYFGCRDGKEINSDLIAVDCLNNSHVTLYSKDTEKVGLTCQCFDVTSSGNKIIISSTENTKNLKLHTSSIDNDHDNVRNHFTTENTRKVNTKSNDHKSPLDTDTTLDNMLQGTILAILSGIVGFIVGSFTTAAILLLIKRKYNEKVHQEQRIRHEETNTLVLDSINIIQSLDIEDIEDYGKTMGHIFLNIPPRNHEILPAEESINCVILCNAVERI
ncbi:unnamed protein product [Mytilus coruscus]|uniref:Uncharacterized protein n=1 Tax=Mytilus coruscus TaxID=42192 RepID=A0A6J8B703_MYTCO|nr:unnamed protein product [Mytilus coruscus]